MFRYNTPHQFRPVFQMFVLYIPLSAPSDGVGKLLFAWGEDCLGIQPVTFENRALNYCMFQLNLLLLSSNCKSFFARCFLKNGFLKVEEKVKEQRSIYSWYSFLVMS